MKKEEYVKKADVFKVLRKATDIDYGYTCLTPMDIVAKIANGVHNLKPVEIAPKLYYVKFLPEREVSYLNFDCQDKIYFISGRETNSRYKTQFTEEEIKALNPIYWEFAIPVPEVYAR